MATTPSLLTSTHGSMLCGPFHGLFASYGCDPSIGRAVVHVLPPSAESEKNNDALPPRFRSSHTTYSRSFNVAGGVCAARDARRSTTPLSVPLSVTHYFWPWV